MLQVKLREVVDYVTGIIAQNAVSSHVKQCIQSQAAAAAATVSAEAEQPIQQAMRQPDLDTRAASLAAFVRPSMDEAFDRVTALGVQQVGLFGCCSVVVGVSKVGMHA